MKTLAVRVFVVLIGLCVPAQVVHSHGGNTSLIHGCLNNKGGIRIVGASVACKVGETARDWNISGATGATGPTGAAGPTGPPGAQLPVVVVDSDNPPKPLGPAFWVSRDLAFITFAFEGNGYFLGVAPAGEIIGGGAGLLFPNSTCTPPGYLERGIPTQWTPIKSAVVARTAAGQELWVQDGAAAPGFVALSRLDEDAPFGCTTSASKGIPRQVNAGPPFRNTGIVFERDYPPPYNVENWPTLP